MSAVRPKALTASGSKGLIARDIKLEGIIFKLRDMKDIAALIEKLEQDADDCDLIAKLATDQQRATATPVPALAANLERPFNRYDLHPNDRISSRPELAVLGTLLPYLCREYL